MSKCFHLELSTVQSIDKELIDRICLLKRTPDGEAANEFELYWEIQIQCNYFKFVYTLHGGWKTHKKPLNKA